MSGKVPPSSRAGSRSRGKTNVDKAAGIFERFTGHDAVELGVFKVPAVPDTVARIGDCDGILYTTVRDGVEEKYIHKFAKGDRPMLCISPDGLQILLLGGRYVFTDRGIVDMSDHKNLPKGYR